MEELLLSCQCGQQVFVSVEHGPDEVTCVRCASSIPIPRGKEAELYRIDGETLKALKDPNRRRIGELLVERKLITSEQLAEALQLQKTQGLKVVEALIALAYFDVSAFIVFLSQQPGMASIELGSYEIPGTVLALIPREFAERHEVFPIDKLGRFLTVGMACPLDKVTIKQLENMTRLRVRPLLCSAQSIHSAIAQYYPHPNLEVPEYIPRAMR